MYVLRYLLACALSLSAAVICGARTLHVENCAGVGVLVVAKNSMGTELDSASVPGITSKDVDLVREASTVEVYAWDNTGFSAVMHTETLSPMLDVVFVVNPASTVTSLTLARDYTYNPQDGFLQDYGIVVVAFMCCGVVSSALIFASSYLWTGFQHVLGGATFRD